MRSRSLGTLAVALALAVPPFAQAGKLTLASTSDEGIKGNGDSRLVSLSADGTKVAFESSATNLDPLDADRFLDVYVKDLTTGDLVLASTSDSGVKGNSESRSASLSADGTKVAFESAATNLDPADHDSVRDIYVKDLITGDLTLVSTSTLAVKGNGDSLNPAISADGTAVDFYTTASNLDPLDRDGIQDVYVKDLLTGGLALASISSTGVKGNNSSYTGAISGDGDRVVFETFASNLDPRDRDFLQDAYVKDLATRALTLASTRADGVKGNHESIYTDISADGTTAAFISYSTNLDPRDGDTLSDIYVKDLDTGELTLASITKSGVKGDSWGWWPDLTGDGTKVAFFTDATNLSPADGDYFEDIYVKDLLSEDLTLVSTADTTTITKGNGDSEWPDLTPDGSSVAFESAATNLDPRDRDRLEDAYVKGLA